MSDLTDSIILETAHRPWRLPSEPWVMFQSWQDLLFAHWRVPAGRLRPLIPPQLAIDEHDGTAWVGLTPFLLTDLRMRGLPPIPPVSEFPEMNLRTYVTVNGRPGIYFFSLDAANRLAVLGARVFNRLPYRSADMSIERDAGWIEYRSQREGADAEFRGRYRSTGETFEAAPGSLEAFLTERYALFVVLRDGMVLRGDIHHRPWLLQPAEAEIERNTVPAAEGLGVLEGEPLLHFSSRQDTLIWVPKPEREGAP